MAKITVTIQDTIADGQAKVSVDFQGDFKLFDSGATLTPAQLCANSVKGLMDFIGHPPTAGGQTLH